jgi:hypothetical protein
VASLLGALAFGIDAPCAQAQNAGKILKVMSDYVTAQKSALISFDSDIEVVTSEMQKVQFTSSGQVLLSRPDKIRATRTESSRCSARAATAGGRGGPRQRLLSGGGCLRAGLYPMPMSGGDHPRRADDAFSNPSRSRPPDKRNPHSRSSRTDSAG